MSVAPRAVTDERTGEAAAGVPLLQVRDLHVDYRTGSGHVPAVRGVSFDLAAGETLGLAGESGCGKSSLAGAIMRLLPRGTEVTGEVLLGGEDVLAMKPGRLRAVRWTDMAIVFQGALHSLNPVQRVGRQIGEAIELHSSGGGRRRVPDRVGEVLELVGLPARRAADYPHQLSGGQRQRVLIALSLACDPQLLVADEPTTALDVMVQAQVLRLLEDLGGEPLLDDPPRVHDRHPPAHCGERREVVRDEDGRQPEALLEVLEQPQDLRLDHHVERSGGLVGDQ